MSRERDVPCCIFQAVFLFCIVFGIFRCIYFVLDMEYAVSVMETAVAVLIPFSLLCSFLYYSRTSRVILLPAAAVLLCFLGYLFRKQLWVYLQCVVTAGIRILNGYYGLSLPEWIEMEKIYSDHFKEGELIFTFLVFFLCSIDVAGFFQAKRLALLLGAVLFFGMCVGKFPSGFSVLLALSGLLGLVPMSSKKKDLCRTWKLGKRRKTEISCVEQEERKEAFLHGETQAAFCTLACFLPILFFCSLSGKKFGAWAENFHAPIQKWANEIEYNVMNYDYGNLIPGVKNPFLKDRQQGILSNQKMKYTGKEILRVTVKKKPGDAMYLRGFLGKDYRNNTWTEAGNSQSFSELARQWGGGSEEQLSLIFNNYTYLALEKEGLRPAWITIEYLDAPGSYAYLPYFSKVNQNLERTEGVVKRKEAGTWLRELTLKGYYELSSSRYELLAETAYHENYNSLYYSYYYRYVMDEYRTVPDSVPRLKKLCEEKKDSDFSTVTDFIYRYLHNRFTYSLDLKLLPYEEDFVEYFLFTQKKGYCIHFATAATLMYRLCGIPARYVEGYVVWPEDFKQNEDGTYTAVVPDSRAHAWTEVYRNGTGFVPVDMTPGSGGVNGSLEDMAEDVTGQEAEEKEENETAGKETDGKEENDGEQEADGKEENAGEKEADGKEENDGEKETDGKEETDGEQETDGKEENTEEQEADGKEETDGEKENDGQEDSGTEEDSGVSEEPQGKQTGGVSDSGTDAGTGTQAKIRKESRVKALVSALIKGVFTAAVGIGIFLCFVIFVYRWRYRKKGRELLRGIRGKKRREAVRLSNCLHGYIQVSGIEKSWRKSRGELSDREYGELFQKRFPFLGDEYEQFQQMVQKALYSPPEKDTVLEEEIEEGRKLAKRVFALLSASLPWYRRFLLKVIVGTVPH